MSEQLELIKALLAKQQAAHDPANSIFGAPAVGAVPGSTPQIGPTLGDIGAYLQQGVKGGFVDPVVGFPQSRQAQNLLSAQQAVQGALSPKPLPSGASPVMGTAQPGKGVQEVSGLLDYLRGPAKLAGDAINWAFDRPFFKGQELTPEERAAMEERGRPESLATNLQQAKERVPDFGFLTGPSDPHQADVLPKTPRHYVFDFGDEPTAEAKPSGSKRQQTADYIEREAAAAGPALPPEAEALAPPEQLSWYERNWPKIQEGLSGAARGAAFQLPVGGGSTGLLLARMASGMDQAFTESADKAEADARYLEGLDLERRRTGATEASAKKGRFRETATGIMDTESGEVTPYTPEQLANLQLIAALSGKGRDTDPRSEKGSKFTARPGATNREQVGANAVDVAMARGLGRMQQQLEGYVRQRLIESLSPVDDRGNKLLHEGELTLSMKSNQEKLAEDMLRNVVLELVSTDLIPGVDDPFLIELQADLMAAGGAGVQLGAGIE
jgi:hypothetical protein